MQPPPFRLDEASRRDCADNGPPHCFGAPGSRAGDRRDPPIRCGANLQIISTTTGASWGAPRDISRFLGPHGQDSAVGPGLGLQLTHGAHAGRLLWIGHHGGYEYDVVWFSDDGGETCAHALLLLALLLLLVLLFLWWCYLA